MPDVRTGTENERGSGGETLIGGRTERAAVSGGEHCGVARKPTPHGADRRRYTPRDTGQTSMTGNPTGLIGQRTVARGTAARRHPGGGDEVKEALIREDRTQPTERLLA